ncbi:MAG: TolC family protein [Fluviicola sp.]|nr:TolC family protein [Fluviicola sp.]
MKKGILFLFISCHFFASSQLDTVPVLSYQDFIDIVKKEHPYARKAELKINEGDATLLYAKGSFDPKLHTKIDQKYFKNDQYYSLINGGLKIPTWFGIEVQGGYEQNQGVFRNPENSTPNSGLLHAGISMPIGKGLLIDKRRAELKKARLFQQVSEMERQIILNELVFNAGTSYWKWFKAYNKLMVYTDAQRLAQERFEAVKLGARIGDRPDIDTLEAGIQLQNRMLGLQQSELELKNATALLSIFLWADGIVPLELAEETVPISMDNAQIMGLRTPPFMQIDSLVSAHPELNQSRYKIDQLEIDRRLKKNQLLPLFNLKYNPITENIGGESLMNFSSNNYTWGLEFQMPVFLRKERGALKLAELKIQDSNLELENKQEIVRYKVISARNQWQTTKQQIELYAQTVKDANNLLEGERRLFDIGESSLFMVNSREVGFIKTQLTFIELLTQNRQAELRVLYAIGKAF